MNLPNQITLLRIFLSVILFGLISFEQYWAALVVFAVAALSDFVDGYIARKYQLITQLGRILDPFADKFLICGVFVFLVAEPGSGIVAWMAVTVMAREFLVTVIRSFLEGEGIDFSANLAGKWKMVFQCALVVASLGKLALGTSAPPYTYHVVLILACLAIGSTIYSGIGYVLQAIKILSSTSKANPDHRRGD